MKPLHQTHFYGGNEPGITRGNCWQTAIACVLDLELDEVPHFVDLHDTHGIDWWHYTTEWLYHRGYEIYRIPTHLYTNEYYFVSGLSPRGNWFHVVIYRNGKMVHDPHPSGEGILEEEDFEVIRPRYIRELSAQRS